MRSALVALVLACTSLPAAGQTRPVTVDDVLDLKAVASPALSPDGLAVLFTVRTWRERTERGAPRRDARTHVWRVAADASSPARQLTFGERGDSQPAWSPDGRYISFLSARGPQGDDEPKAQIWVMRSDGGEAWALTEAAESVLQYAWSPDAKTIAFTMTDPREDAAETAVRARDDEKVFEDDYRRIHLWVVDLATRTATRVTSGEAFTISGALSWSADNVHVAFAAGVTPLLRDGRRDVFVADTGAKTVEKITTNFGPDGTPRYSPDGRTIAYLARAGDGAGDRRRHAAGDDRSVARDALRRGREDHARCHRRAPRRPRHAALERRRRPPDVHRRRSRLRQRLRARAGVGAGHRVDQQADAAARHVQRRRRRGSRSRWTHRRRRPRCSSPMAASPRR